MASGDPVDDANQTPFNAPAPSGQAINKSLGWDRIRTQLHTAVKLAAASAEEARVAAEAAKNVIVVDEDALNVTECRVYMMDDGANKEAAENALRLMRLEVEAELTSTLNFAKP